VWERHSVVSLVCAEEPFDDREELIVVPRLLQIGLGRRLEGPFLVFLKVAAGYDNERDTTEVHGT
jgi:hypothetical protein